MNLRAAITLAIALFASAQAAAQPTDLDACLSGGGPQPLCEDIHAASVLDIFCDPIRVFELYNGRVAWAPLRCVGPITIALNTRSLTSTRFPLYVEIVPVQNLDHCPGPGVLVMVAHGGNQCGGIWETSGPLDITSIVPLGSLYAIQLVFFYAAYGAYLSPAVDCIRVTAQPMAIEARTWSQVKTLYR